MSAAPRLPRCRRKLPAPNARTMDFLGMAEDGALYLWQANGKVQPLSAFPMEGASIKEGHYVLNVKGQAVTAHCSNGAELGHVVVQWMCRAPMPKALPLAYVAPDLLGQVIRDPEKEGEILRLLRQMAADAAARQQAPHRRRGQA